jgi:uncharacterized protein YjaG (DUF416 family)
MLKFDPLKLVGELEKLPAMSRGTFAASASTRIFPSYVAYCKQSGRGHAAELGATLQSAWTHLEGSLLSREALQQQHQIAYALTKVPVAGSADLYACAQDATAAVAYCLRFLMTQDTKDAALSAISSHDAAYQLASCIMTSESEIVRTHDAELWLSHPLVQTELMRQERDLAALRSADQQELSAAIKRLHKIAAHEAITSLRETESPFRE